MISINLVSTSYLFVSATSIPESASSILINNLFSLFETNMYHTSNSSIIAAAIIKIIYILILLSENVFI